MKDWYKDVSGVVALRTRRGRNQNLASLLHAVEKSREERRLANARLPIDEDDCAVAVNRPCQRCLQNCGFGIASG
jgi:hypothetical protein